jgi:hypothetical protein
VLEFLDKHLGTIARLLVTLVLLGLLAWILSKAVTYLGTEPTRNKESGLVTLDPLQNSKDILAIIVALLGPVLGWWFGAAGKQKAEDRAAEATDRADTAQNQLSAVLSVAPETDLIEKAKVAYPSAFTDRH